MNKSELKLEYNKILMDNNMHPYSDQQMKITEFVDKLIGMIGQVITEDRIVEVLEKELTNWSMPLSSVKGISGKYLYEIFADKIKQIASQILQDNKWEEVARGKVGYGFNGYTLDEKLLSNLMGKSMLKREGKNIEVAVREVK